MKSKKNIYNKIKGRNDYIGDEDVKYTLSQQNAV